MGRFETMEIATERVSILGTINEIKGIALGVMNATQGRLIEFPEEFTFLLSTERVVRNIQSIEPLVNGGIHLHEHGLGLLSRTILTDFITIAYSVYFSDRPDLRSSLYKIYASDKATIDSHMKRSKEFGIVSQQEHDNYFKAASEINSFPKKVDDYYQGKKLPRFPSLGDIADKVPKEDPTGSEIKAAYEQWFLYSKFEHMGYLTFVLTRKVEDDIIEFRLRLALYYAFRTLQIGLDMLDKEEAWKQVSTIIAKWLSDIDAHPLKPS